MIKLNKYKSLESINRDFFKLSNYFQSIIGKYWWFMNFSRLDLAPLGIPKNENFFEKIKNFAFSLLIFIKFFLHTFFIYKKKNLKKHNKIFVFEEIQLNFKLKKKEDYYFKNISKLTKTKFKNLIVGLKIYNDNKNYSIFELFERNEILKIFIKCFLIYFKFLIKKDKLINHTLNIKFWKTYQRKNNFLNFFLTNLVYNFFEKFNFKKNIIIYPYEEKPFERAININVKKNYKVFAYLINPRDKLALYFKKYKNFNIPRCHKYLFSGKISETRFNKNLRDNLLFKKNPVVGLSKGITKKINFYKSNSFLVLIGHPYEFTIIFNSLINEFDKLKIKFIFRFPPGINTESYKKILNRYKNFSISNNRSLSDDCNLVKYSIFSNTSAGIESVNLGLVAIWFKTYNLNISPLDKKDYKIFFSSKSKQDLFKQIVKLINSDKKAYERYHANQFKISEKMYSKFNSKKFKKLINV